MKTARHQPPSPRPCPAAGVHPSVKRARKLSASEGSVLSLEVQRRGAVCLVSPHGRIGEAEAHPFQRELLALADQGATTDPRGPLRRLLHYQQLPRRADGPSTNACAPQGGYVRLASPQPLVQRVLEITKLTRLFGGYRTVREALAAK